MSACSIQENVTKAIGRLILVRLLSFKKMKYFVTVKERAGLKGHRGRGMISVCQHSTEDNDTSSEGKIGVI